MGGNKRSKGGKERLDSRRGVLERGSEAQSKNEKAHSRRDLLIAIIGGLAGAAVGGAATVAAPLLSRQERLGIATSWSYRNLAGTNATPLPVLGEEWDPAPFLEKRAMAFREGTLVLSLNAEKDKSYIITDITVAVKDFAPNEEASWYFTPMPAASGGPSVHILDISYDLDSRSWVNVREPERVFANSKFDPFILGADSSATVNIWLKGKKRDYECSVVVRYQGAGDDKIEETDVGNYAIYAARVSVPAFTTNRENVLIPATTATLL
ncbi:hypothetical protein [Arthrobacter sp. BE255]|uniref:hypothetical protein n=1 Tax=Arthrobacter sp. BE255 TaxID=2817721 RepID=UPI00285A4EFF|nr:hypothetical protein [Arthrobacter sp. BE255]MDR7161395.1 hypothetical protein [Arthrobacter sp. BE255]